MFRHGERLIIERGEYGMSEICLYSRDIDMHISWPSVDFCLFGSDDRLPHCKYTSIFEMTKPDWKYHTDVQKFAENNRWMLAYIGCASQEELTLRISVMAQ